MMIAVGCLFVVRIRFKLISFIHFRSIKHSSWRSWLVILIFGRAQLRFFAHRWFHCNFFGVFKIKYHVVVFCFVFSETLYFFLTPIIMVNHLVIVCIILIRIYLVYTPLWRQLSCWRYLFPAKQIKAVPQYTIHPPQHQRCTTLKFKIPTSK